MSKRTWRDISTTDAYARTRQRGGSHEDAIRARDAARAARARGHDFEAFRSHIARTPQDAARSYRLAAQQRRWEERKARWDKVLREGPREAFDWIRARVFDQTDPRSTRFTRLAEGAPVDVPRRTGRPADPRFARITADDAADARAVEERRQVRLTIPDRRLSSTQRLDLDDPVELRRYTSRRSPLEGI